MPIFVYEPNICQLPEHLVYMAWAKWPLGFCCPLYHFLDRKFRIA